MSIGKVIKVGRPSIAESDVPPHIKEALLFKSQGMSWKDSANSVGLKKYQSLKEWVNKNEKAKLFYKEAVQEREERIQDKLNNSYEILIDSAPEVATELLKIIRNEKSKSYARTEAINCFFRIIERGHTDKKMAEQLKETREKIYQLENGRPLQMTESPFDN